MIDFECPKLRAAHFLTLAHEARLVGNMGRARFYLERAASWRRVAASNAVMNAMSTLGG